jgi:hypothetical protein
MPPTVVSTFSRIASIFAICLAAVAVGEVVSTTPAAHASFGEVDFRLYVLPNDISYGETVRLLATAADDSSSCDVLDCNTPTGIVRFYDFGQLVGAVALQPGALVHTAEARLDLTTLEPGSHNFSAYYTGDFDSNNSSQNDDYISVDTDVQVSKAQCSIALTVDRATTMNETSLPVFTADLGSTGHTGTVDFLGPNNILFGRAAVTSGRFATYTLPYLYPGATTLHAVYYGDNHYMPCQSGSTTHTLVPGEVHTGEVIFPVVSDDSYTIDIGSTLTADVVSNDITFFRPVALTLVDDEAPTRGTATVTTDNRISYVPDPDFTTGTDTFSYRLTVADGSNSDGNSNDGTVRITVGCVASGKSDSYTVQHGQALTVESPGALFNDKPCGSTAALGSQPTHGSVSFDADGGFVYTPDADYEGPDSFTYTLSEDTGHPISVQLIVGGVACVPELVDDDFSAMNGAASVPAPGLRSNDTTCGNILAIGTPPQHGTVVLTPTGGFDYVAEPGYSGPDSFTYGIAAPSSKPAPAGIEAIRPDVAAATVNLVVTADPNATTTTIGAVLPPAPGDHALPITGGRTRPLVPVALLFVTAGATAVMLSRRRRWTWHWQQ